MVPPVQFCYTHPTIPPRSDTLSHFPREKQVIVPPFCTFVALALLFWLGFVQASQGGLYNTAEPVPEVWPAADFQHFHATLTDLRTINLQTLADSAIRKRYLLMAKVDPRRRADDWTPEQRANLGAYLVRLRRYDEAIEVLQQAEAQDRKNFMVQSSLGTAYQLTDHYDRAIFYLEQGLRNWPQSSPIFSEIQLKRYQEAEKAQLELVRLRYQESLRQPPGRQQAPEAVDALFPVRFVGNSGRFEAGQIAAAEKAKLPANALALVEQLLIWLPDDLRLYWLLGEILNARGDVNSAATVFDELVWKYRFSALEVQQHRQILQDQPKAAPGVSALSDQQTEVSETTRQEGSNVTSLLAAAGVGAVAGIIVALLFHLQIREIRRRRGMPAGKG